jgi:hypothetical protein
MTTHCHMDTLLNQNHGHGRRTGLAYDPFDITNALDSKHGHHIFVLHCPAVRRRLQTNHY